MRKVAITGGIASGKSSVCQIFSQLGAYVVRADELIHKLLSPDTPLGKKIIKLLGEEIITEKGLSRKKIAEKVFPSPEKLEALEKLLHPSLLIEISKLYREVQKREKYPLFVVEIPLVFEIENESFYDEIIAVYAEENICIERWKSKGFSLQDYKQRMARQLPASTKMKRADFTITNNGTFAELKEQVTHIFHTLTKKEKP